MMRSEFEALEEFIPERRLEYELVVAHPTTEWISTVETLFDSESVEVSHQTISEVEQATLVLFHNGEAVTSSPVEALTETITEINTTIRTGAVESLDSIELPSVLTALDELPFAAHESYSLDPKLLFTTITRYIEAMAIAAGNGQLRVGLQRLSRLKPAEGDFTHSVYNRLAETAVDVHVYGRPDWMPPESLAATVHGGYTEDFLQNWYLVYRSATETANTALIARQSQHGAWCGHWTFDSDRVSQINRYLEQRL